MIDRELATQYNNGHSMTMRRPKQSDRVSIAELKAKLSEFLRKVRNGHSLLVTDHGTPVARLAPLETPGLNRVPAQRPFNAPENAVDYSPLTPPRDGKADEEKTPLSLELLLEDRRKR
jgi:prevent-host-death family protein